MREEERKELVSSAAEAHSGLREVASRLQCRLDRKAPALIAAVKAEQELFRLRRELQRLELSGPDPAKRRGPFPEVRRGDKVVDPGRLRR